MAMSFDGRGVATVGVTHDGKTFNSTVKLWDTKSGELVRALEEEKDSHLEIASSREYLAVAVNDRLNDPSQALREVRLFDAATLELRHKIDRTLVPEAKTWTALAFSADGRKLAAAGRDNAPFIKLFHLQKNRLVVSDAPPVHLPIEVKNVISLAMSPDGRLLAAGCDDSSLRLYSGVSAELRGTLSLGADEAPLGFRFMGIAFSADGRTLVSAGQNTDVLLWNVDERKPRQSLKGHQGSVSAIAISPDGERLASGSRSTNSGDRSEVLVWDLKSGELKQSLPDLELPVNELAFTPDGRTLAICAGAGREMGGRIATTGELRLVRLK